MYTYIPISPPSCHSSHPPSHPSPFCPKFPALVPVSHDSDVPSTWVLIDCHLKNREVMGWQQWKLTALHALCSAVPSPVPGLSSLLSNGVHTMLFMKLAPSASLKMPIWWPEVIQQKFSERCTAHQRCTASEPAGTPWWWFHSNVKISIGLIT